MTLKPINDITQAIKTFDISALKKLLDYDKTYIDVSKSRYLKKLENKIELNKWA